MAIHEKINQIAGIDEQLSTLEQVASTTRAEISNLIDKRDKLNDEFRKIRKEVHDLKNERDSLNEKVQNLKMLRDETRSKTQATFEILKGATAKIRELQKKTPKRSNIDLQEELDGIEWKIQTTSLELNEEKKLIENVKQLETQLSAYKRIEEKRKKMTDLRKNVETLNTQADEFHSELRAAVQKSQEIHIKMLSKIVESKRVKAEADKVHSAYIEAKEKAEPASKKYRILLEQKRMLQEQLKKEEKTKQKIKQEELKDKIVSEAREKLQRGKKLSWNEFQLLSEDDSQKQN